MNTAGTDRRAVLPRADLLTLRNAWIGRLAARPVTATIAVVTLILNCPGIAEHAFGPLVFSREALDAGAWWTVFSGPLHHLSGPHLAFDVLGLLFVGWAFEPLLRGWYGWIGLVVTFAVAATFLIAYPRLDSYHGLSALDQGLFCAGLAALWRHGDRVLAGALLLAIAAKWIAELSGGQTVLACFAFDAAAFGSPVPWTHVAGGLAGLLCGVLVARLREPVGSQNVSAFAAVDGPPGGGDIDGSDFLLGDQRAKESR